MRYKFTLQTGQSFEVEDKRTLAKISAELCEKGFVVVQREAGGYSVGTREIAVLERTVSTIESLPVNTTL